MNMNERIAARRKELKLTQTQVAKAIGSSTVSVYKWENGEVAPRGKNLFALSEVLRCSPSWLLTGDEYALPTPAGELPRALSKQEEDLLELFGKLPASEREAQLEEIRLRVEHFNRLFEEMLEARKK